MAFSIRDLSTAIFGDYEHGAWLLSEVEAVVFLGKILTEIAISPDAAFC